MRAMIVLSGSEGHDPEDEADGSSPNQFCSCHLGVVSDLNEFVNDLCVVFSTLVIPHRPTQADHLTGSLNAEAFIIYNCLRKLFSLTGL